MDVELVSLKNMPILQEQIAAYISARSDEIFLSKKSYRLNIIWIRIRILLCILFSKDLYVVK